MGGEENLIPVGLSHSTIRIELRMMRVAFHSQRMVTIGTTEHPQSKINDVIPPSSTCKHVLQ